MAGRPSKPIQLLKSENKSHRTKAELEHREKMEKSLKTNTRIKEEPATKSDPIAHKEFLRLRKLYKEIEFVDGLDSEVVNRYCQLRSQESMLQDFYSDIKEAMDTFTDVADKLELFAELKDVISKQNQVRDKMLKLEDRLFLNPVARMKSIPKEPPKKDSSNMSKFLERRSYGNN